jgi:hypothetical protein
VNRPERQRLFMEISLSMRQSVDSSMEEIMKKCLSLILSVGLFSACAVAAAKNIKYEQCLAGAEKRYSENWAAECRFLSTEMDKKRMKCRSEPANAIKGFEYCTSRYPSTDSSPKCALPHTQATRVNEKKADAKRVCLEEAKAGL